MLPAHRVTGGGRPPPLLLVGFLLVGSGIRLGVRRSGARPTSHFSDVAPTIALAEGLHVRAAAKSLHIPAARAGTSSASTRNRASRASPSSRPPATDRSRAFRKSLPRSWASVVWPAVPFAGPTSHFAAWSLSSYPRNIQLSWGQFTTLPIRRLLCEVRTAGLGRLSLPTDVRAAPVVTQIGHWIGRTQFIDHARSR